MTEKKPLFLFDRSFGCLVNCIVIMIYAAFAVIGVFLGFVMLYLFLKVNVIAALLDFFSGAASL